jgi:hypothetical protein
MNTHSPAQNTGRLRHPMIEKATMFFRQLSACKRSLPHAIIIGAQRCGTTSLFDFMIQHPAIHAPTKKEIHYFSIFYEKGENWYRAHFPLRTQMQKDEITAEASPYYLYHPYASERLYAHVPDAKIIVLLRNPVERALSQYFLEVKLGRETLSLEDALLAEEERIAPEREKMAADSSYYSQLHQWFSYCSRGKYIESLKKYNNYKKDNRVLVLQSEEFFRDPHSVMHTLFQFLNVDDTFLCTDVHPRNVGTNRTKVPGKVYCHLEEYFAPYNEKLYAYINRRFDW